MVINILKMIKFLRNIFKVQIDLSKKLNIYAVNCKVIQSKNS